MIGHTHKQLDREINYYCMYKRIDESMKFFLKVCINKLRLKQGGEEWCDSLGNLIKISFKQF